LFKHKKRGRTGFDSSLEAQAACRGWFVGLVKNRTKKQTQTTNV
jgi:beta-lactamase class D